MTVTQRTRIYRLATSTLTLVLAALLVSCGDDGGGSSSGGGAVSCSTFCDAALTCKFGSFSDKSGCLNDCEDSLANPKYSSAYKEAMTCGLNANGSEAACDKCEEDFFAKVF